MESITFSASTQTKYADKPLRIDDESLILVKHINFILEQIIINTLQYNKLTSAEEIYEKLILEFSESQPSLVNETEIGIIDRICGELCNNNGVLIRLVKNNTSLYKLNHKNYI